MFESEIDALVHETFSHSKENGQRNPFNEDFNFYDSPSDIELEVPEEVPGVLYHLELKGSTFVIRVFPCENLAQDYQKALNYPEDFPSLRLITDDEDCVHSRLCFFECDSIHLAQKIKQQLANKRFPIYEENILNISDPGDSWWVKADKGQMRIFFKLSRTESIDSLIKLGPLGDSNDALDIFNKLYGYFQLLFPVADYSSAHGQLCVKCEDDQDPIFKAFSEIFISGDPNHSFWTYLRDLEMKSLDKPYLESLKKANLFLMEIANIRRFWTQIQQKLS